MQIADLNADRGARLSRRGGGRRIWSAARRHPGGGTSAWAMSRWSRTAGRCPGTIRSRKRSTSCWKDTGEMCLGEERQTLDGRPGRLHPVRRVPPDDQYRRRRRCGCSTATARPAMSPTGGRNWKARCRKPGRRARRCPQGAQPQHTERVADGDCPRRASRQGTLHNDDDLPHHTLGVIMNGVTGRMGTNQHLMRSIVAIRAAGRRQAQRRRRHHAGPDPGRAQRGQAGSAGARGRRRRAGPPIWTPRWPTRTTRSTSTPS